MLGMNERTLELNVGHEILAEARSYIGNASFLAAISQQLEGEEGYDYAVNYGNGHVIYFQFKAPKRKSEDGVYTFVINNNRNKDQHDRLYRFAYGHNFVYYVFPLIHSISELRTSLPDVLSRTIFVHVLEIPEFNDHREHQVKISFSPGFPIPNILSIHSMTFSAKGLEWAEMVKGIANKKISIDFTAYDQLIQKIIQYNIPISKQELKAIHRKSLILIVNKDGYAR